MRADGVGTFVAQARTGGSVTISNVTATDVGAAGYPQLCLPGWHAAHAVRRFGQLGLGLAVGGLRLAVTYQAMSPSSL